MAQILPTTAVYSSPFTRPEPTTRLQNPHPTWVPFRRNVKCNGLFSNNRKQEQAKKALESALGGKKTEFEKWDEEIKKRAELSGGGEGGGGGWFGRGGGWFNGDHFWPEAQQTSFAILGVIFMYLLFTQCEMIIATIVNPVLSGMRKLRNGLDTGMRKLRNGLDTGKSWILQNVASTKRAKLERMPKEEGHTRTSAKERVVSKWRTD